MRNNRLIGLDILRALAVVSVIAGHFFAINTPFNNTPFVGASIFVQGWMKSFFQGFGVPMFLMLSGYFCCHYELSAKYYKGITKVIYTYIFISVVTWMVLSANHSPLELLLGITGFKVIHYAWYIEMYLGLFLLIPFINMALQKTFENKRHAQWLILILLLLCSLPTTLDRGDYKLIPSYWMENFPILYYCIGAYVRYFQPTVKHKSIAVLSVFVLPAVSPCLMMCYNVLMEGEETYMSIFGAYYSIVYLITDVLLFLMLYKVERLPKIIAKPVTSVAVCSLDIFLFSYLSDKLIYPYFMDKFYTSQSAFLLYFVPIVLIVLIASWIATQLKIIIFDIVENTWKKIIT